MRQDSQIAPLPIQSAQRHLVTMHALRQAIEGVINAAQPLEDLVTGGQPHETHLRALAAAGCTVVIDLRDPMEPRPIDERETVEALGLRYVNHPVHSGVMDDQTLQTLTNELESSRPEPAFIHCASGSRVGAVLIPYLILKRGLSEDAAIKTAMGVGLRSAELLEWALDYSRRSLDPR